MIDLVCPECGEEMEISQRMRGRRVECVECGTRFRVPERSRRQADDAGLPTNEYWLFELLFLFIPGANLIVSSVLYYLWKRDYPRRANQINTLGFIIFGIHILLYILFAVVRNR
jgi:hypothetical protein